MLLVIVQMKPHYVDEDEEKVHNIKVQPLQINHHIASMAFCSESAIVASNADFMLILTDKLFPAFDIFIMSNVVTFLFQIVHVIIYNE